MIDSSSDRLEWEKIAAEYDELQGTTGDPFHEAVLDPVLFELLGDIKDQDVLDAGCGNGYLTAQLLTKGARVIGIDGSETLIERAHQRFPDVTVLTHDLTKPLPFESAQFDQIVCSMVLHTLAEPALVLEEFFRVLKPSGSLIVAIPHPAFAQPASRTRRTVIAKLLGKSPDLLVVDYLTQRWRICGLPSLTQHTTRRYHRPLERYWEILSKVGFQLVTLREPALSSGINPDPEHRLPTMVWSQTIPFVMVLKVRKVPE